MRLANQGSLAMLVVSLNTVGVLMKGDKALPGMNLPIPVERSAAHKQRAGTGS